MDIIRFPQGIVSKGFFGSAQAGGGEALNLTARVRLKVDAR